MKAQGSRLFEFVLAVVIAMTTSIFGCGSSNEEDACQQLVDRVCQKAQACASNANAHDDICMESSGGNREMCYSGSACAQAFGRDLCQDTTKTKTLFSACAADFGQTTCTDGAAKLPASCDKILECESGPCLD